MSYTSNASIFPMSYSDSHGPMSGVTLSGAGKYPNPFLGYRFRIYTPRFGLGI